MDYGNKEYDIKVNGPEAEPLTAALSNLLKTPNQTKYVFFQMDAAREDSQQALFKVDTHATPCKISFFDLNEHAATSMIMGVIQKLPNVDFFDASKAYKLEQNKPFLMGLEKRMYIGHHHNVASARELIETVKTQPVIEAGSYSQSQPVIPDKAASKLGRLFGLFSGSFNNKNKHMAEKTQNKKNIMR